MELYIGIAVYAIGFVAWYFIERRFFPYEEGAFSIDFDGPHEQTIDMQRDDRLMHCILWPLFACVFIVLGPLALLTRIFEKYDL